MHSALDVTATQADKVMEPTEQETSKSLCGQFHLDLEQFNRKLRGSTSIPIKRWSEYPWLPCYYAARVDGIEYRLRLGGLVEIRGTDDHVREYRHWQD
ncbi:hypothetical protein [Paracidovorax cattleyae]|nr:hypothetical protein [Paracidovorax cattleyae]MBF9266276.1 hypothetical protein [Paracidovorax cattleyae]